MSWYVACYMLHFGVTLTAAHQAACAIGHAPVPIVTLLQVAHGPLCTELFGWDALDISITYLSFVVAGVIGIMLSLCLSDEVR